jgi:hypothetical protein
MPGWATIIIIAMVFISGFFCGLSGAWWMLKKIMQSGDLPNIEKD